jgi:hypothetical protein
MPIRVGWGNEERTFIYVQFVGEWTWEDYYQAYETWLQLVKGVSHNVSTLANFSDSRGIPQGALTHFHKTFTVVGEKGGEFIVVGADTMIITFGHMLKKMNPKLQGILRTMETIEDAREYLASE